MMQKQARLSRKKKKIVRKQLALWWSPGPRSKLFWANTWSLLATIHKYDRSLFGLGMGPRPSWSFEYQILHSTILQTRPAQLIPLAYLNGI